MIRRARAEWLGTLKTGTGKLELSSGAYEGPYSFGSRFADEPGTNPEELLGAAHAGCFSMALAAGLERAGSPATRIDTKAAVTVEKVGDGFSITRIDLTCEGEVPGIDAATFAEHAEKTKTTCIVSRALSAIPTITLDAKLVG